MKLSDNRRLGNLVKQARKEAGLKQEELGVEVGVGRDAVSKWERGVKPMSTHNLELIADATSKPMTWFFEVGDVTSESAGSALDSHELRRIFRDELKALAREVRRFAKPQKAAAADRPAFTIPLLGHVPAGRPTDAISGAGETIVVPMHWRTRGEELFALRVHGPSMEPSICNGDIVVVRRQADASSGQIVVALLEGVAPEGEATIKRLVRSTKGTFLKADNPKHPPIPLSPEAAIAGVVVGLMREY